MKVPHFVVYAINMMKLLQSFFIIIFTPIAKVTSRIDSRIRNVCIHIICLSFPLYFVTFYVWLKHTDLFPEFFHTHNGKHVLGCALLLLLIVFSLDRVPGKVKWNKWIMYPMVICGIWMLVISFIHPVGNGYRAFAMMLVIAYPCLYFVWNNRGDYDNLFTPMSRAIALIGILYFVSCFALAAQGDLLIVSGRCAGQLSNSNLFSMIGMTTTCAALYLLIRDRVFNWLFLINSIALGAGYAVVWMGQSRISAMVCLANTIIALFFYIRYSEKTKISIIILKIICMIAIVMNMLLLSYLCIDIQKASEAQKSQGIITEQKTAQVAEEQSQTVIDRLSVDENATLDSYTAGRYHIWQGYAKFLNLTGNDFYKSDWSSLTRNKVKHAHNNFLEMSYRFGIPLGALFVFLEVIACLKALQYFFQNRQQRIVVLFSILFTVMFFFESLLDIATLPFERDAPFYFYIALIPMVDMNYNVKSKL